MKPLQDQDNLPIYLSSVDLILPSLSAQLSGYVADGLKTEVRDYLRVPGMLMTIIGGFSLVDRGLRSNMGLLYHAGLVRRQNA
jgi:hypothetical protein